MRAAVVSFAALNLASQVFAADGGEYVYARYDARAVHIETIGILYNDTQEVGAGSGLLVGDSLVLTNNHIIPLQSNYRTLQLLLRPKTRTRDPIQAVAIYRDPDRDLALLETATAVPDAGGVRCPMPAIENEDSAGPGSVIFMLGFPVDQDLSIVDGIISNHSGAQGRWQTNAVMNPGNSGGPVFNRNGVLVGTAVSGIVKWSNGHETIDVDGVNFIIPTTVIRESPLFNRIQDIPVDRRCWRDGSEEALEVVAEAAAPAEERVASERALPRPAKLNRTYVVSETKDDHPVVLAPHKRNYKHRFESEAGYRIVGCSGEPTSANHAEMRCVVEPAGHAVEVTLTLESGPAVDQWRGWWVGSITTEQILE